MVPTKPPTQVLTTVLGTIDFGNRSYADVCPGSETYPFDIHGFSVLFTDQSGETISVHPDSYRQGGCDDYGIFQVQLYSGEYEVDIAPHMFGSAATFSTTCWLEPGWALTCAGPDDFVRFFSYPNEREVVASELPLAITVAPDKTAHLYVTIGTRTSIIQTP